MLKLDGVVLRDIWIIVPNLKTRRLSLGVQLQAFLSQRQVAVLTDTYAELVLNRFQVSPADHVLDIWLWRHGICGVCCERVRRLSMK